MGHFTLVIQSDHFQFGHTICTMCECDCRFVHAFSWAHVTRPWRLAPEFGNRPYTAAA